MAHPPSIGCCLLVVCLVAVEAARVTRDFEGKVGMELKVLDAPPFAVSLAQVTGLCPEKVVREACSALGVPPGQRATKPQVAETLDESEEDVGLLLSTLGLGDEFGCQELCEGAVAKIPALLGEAAPARPGIGCLSPDCSDAGENVSEQALDAQGLPPAPQENETELPEPTEQEQDGSSFNSLPPDVRGRMLFRSMLNVLFGVFPAPEVTDDEEGSKEVSLMEEEEVPAFGPNVHRGRIAQYREYVLKGSAWIATAIRKMRSEKSRRLLVKWFHLDRAGGRAAVDQQARVARRHLKGMLKALELLYVKKAFDKPQGHCSVSEYGGTLAFVMARVHCTVDSNGECGQRKAGRYVVNICEMMWRFDESTRVSTFVHESSHHFGTKDYAYGKLDAMRLTPEQARMNADTYTLFISDLVSSRDIPEFSGNGWAPNPRCDTECGTKGFEDWKFDLALPEDTCGTCEERFRYLGGSCSKIPGAVSVSKGLGRKLCCVQHKCEKPGAASGAGWWRLR